MSRQLAAARKHLSDAQLLAFLRAAEEDGIRAPRIFLYPLRGRAVDLDADFAHYDRPASDGRMHVVLQVQPLSPRVFRITFGFHGEVGDGGVWRVVFTAGGAMQRIQQEGFWRH